MYYRDILSLIQSLLYSVILIFLLFFFLSLFFFSLFFSSYGFSWTFPSISTLLHIRLIPRNLIFNFLNQLVFQNYKFCLDFIFQTIAQYWCVYNY